MLCVAEALSSVVWANGPVGARILVAGSGDTCSVLVCFPCKRPMFVCPSLRKYLLTSLPQLAEFPCASQVPLSPPSQVPRAVNERGCNDAAARSRVLSGWRARSDVCHRPCPSIPECCALHSQAVFCTALERNKHRSDPRRAQLNSSQRQGHTVRSRPARFWPRTSTTTAREPLSTRWRKSRSPSTRSSCAKVRHCARVHRTGRRLQSGSLHATLLLLPLRRR